MRLFLFKGIGLLNILTYIYNIIIKIMKTLLYVCIEKIELLNIINKCITYNISFEYMNNIELYFTVYDDEDYLIKQGILGEKIINIKNFIN
jgi:hypothetical protein